MAETSASVGARGVAGDARDTGDAGDAGNAGNAGGAGNAEPPTAVPVCFVVNSFTGGGAKCALEHGATAAMVPERAGGPVLKVSEWEAMGALMASEEGKERETLLASASARMAEVSRVAPGRASEVSERDTGLSTAAMEALARVPEELKGASGISTVASDLLREMSAVSETTSGVSATALEVSEAMPAVSGKAPEVSTAATEVSEKAQEGLSAELATASAVSGPAPTLERLASVMASVVSDGISTEMGLHALEVDGEKEEGRLLAGGTPAW